MNNDKGSSKEVKPVELPTISFMDQVDQLWTLSYMRNNTIKTTILYMEPDLPINIVVERAKLYCKERSVNFTWIEKSIVDLTKGNEEKI